MIGILPKSLNIDGQDYPIRSDYRVALLIFEAFDDRSLNIAEKVQVCVECLFEEVPDDIEKAYEKASWFLDGGDMPKSKKAPTKLIDWKQDEHYIFSAINKTAGKEVRELEYMHWWTFLGLFSEMGEGLYSQVVNIRRKKAKGKKLEKYEQEFYRDNKDIIDIHPVYTEEEKAEIDFINDLVGEV